MTKPKPPKPVEAWAYVCPIHGVQAILTRRLPSKYMCQHHALALGDLDMIYCRRITKCVPGMFVPSGSKAVRVRLVPVRKRK